MDKERLWTKDFISITSISFFIFLAFYVVLSVLPLYLVENLQAGTDKVGLVITLFLLAAIIIRPFAGQWMSKGSQKKILVYSSIAFFICTLLYPMATDIWALLVLRVAHGITFGIITTVKGTICAEIIPISRRGEGLSYFSMAMGLAMVFGPYIGLKFANINAYNTAFITCMIISAVNIILALFMKVPETKEKVNVTLEKIKFSWNNIFDKNAVPYALATFILACAYSGISGFLALYAKDIDLATTASSFFLIYAVFVLITRPFTGRWSDQFGTKVIIYPSLIVFAVGMLLLNQTRFSGMMLIAGAFIGVGYGSITPIFQTQTISSVEPHRVGIANSLFFNSMDAGMAIGAYVLGIVASAAGYRSIYLIGVVLIVATGLLYFVLTKKKEESDFYVENEYEEIV
ncbi:MAG TPA: MFS transporter [Clostridium sp.]|uniref:MFS transporter n=1 Tax=Clostridium sp. TaxID=1506 RepID=UPI002F91F2A4